MGFCPRNSLIQLLLTLQSFIWVNFPSPAFNVPGTNNHIMIGKRFLFVFNEYIVVLSCFKIVLNVFFFLSLEDIGESHRERNTFL